MQLILEILTGPLAGKKTWIRQGQTFKIGRTEAADYALPHDSAMSGVHFSAECLSNGCRIRDLKSRNGTFVNGQKIEEASVQNGDEVSAGKSRFRIQLERDPADVLEGLPAPPFVSSPARPAAPVVQPPPVKAPREFSAPPPAVPANRPQPPAPPPVPPPPPPVRQPERPLVPPSQDPWEQPRPAPPPQVEQPPVRPRPKEPVANRPPVVPPSPPAPPAPVPPQAPPLFGRRAQHPDIRTSDPFADVPQLPADDFRITNPNAGRRPIDPEADWGEPTVSDPWAGGAAPPPPAVPGLGDWRDFLGGPGVSEPDLSDDWLERSQDDLWSAAAAARHPEGESSEKTPPTDAWGELHPLPPAENPVQGDPVQGGPPQGAPLHGEDIGPRPPEARDNPRPAQESAPSPPPSPLEWGDLQNQPVGTHDSSPTLPPPYEPLTPFAPSRESPAPIPATPSAPDDDWHNWNAGGATAPPVSDPASFTPAAADEKPYDAPPRQNDAPAPPVAADDWSAASNGEWPDAAGSTLDAGPKGWVDPNAAPPAIQRGPVARGEAPAEGIVGSPEAKAGATPAGRADAKSTDRSKSASVGGERAKPAGMAPSPAPPLVASPASASDVADDSEDDMLVLSHVKSPVPIRKTATDNPPASDQASKAARPSAAGSKSSSAPTVPPRSSDPKIRTSGVGSGPSRAPAARESAGKDSQRSKVNAPSSPPAASQAASAKASRKPDPEVKIIDFAKYATVQGNRLYAVVDRALKPELVTLAHKLELTFECLRPGELTPQVARVSPFLIEVGSNSIFLAKWGNELGTDAGVLMESPEDFKAVMKHYRAMYMAPDADGIESTYRFFDPKEVRRQVSDSTPAKLAAFFGPVTVLVAESEDPAILDRYVFGPSGLFWTRLRVQGS